MNSSFEVTLHGSEKPVFCQEGSYEVKTPKTMVEYIIPMNEAIPS